MGFQHTTYEKALQAIAHDDLAALKRLISTPVDDDGPKHRARLEHLVGEAAQRGQKAMVYHLAQQASLREDHYLQLAWAVALAAGHTELAQFILYEGGRPRPRFHAHTRFNHACREQAWAAVVHLMKHEDHVPSEVDLAILFSELRREATPALIPVSLLPLGYRAPADSLADVLMVAMRTNQEALCTDALERIDSAHLTSNVGELLEQAVACNRYDWAKRLDQALRPSWSDDAWIEGVISQAVDTSQLTFLQAALDDRPTLVNRIQGSLTGTGPGKFLGLQLVTRADDDEPEALRSLRVTLLGRLYPGDALDHVRAQIEAISGMDPLAGHLNRLALMAPDTVRERWFDEKPITFGPAIAVVRERQATLHLAPSDRRRPRVRT